jgi:hydrogenase-4 component B
VVSYALPVPAIQALQVVTIAAAAPTVSGVIALVEARLQGRRGPRGPALLAVVMAVTFLAARGRMFRVRRVPAWRSATAGVEGADQYTAFGYTNPTRRVLAGVLLTRTELRSISEAADPDAEPGAPPVPHLGYTSDVLELVEEFLYRPLLRPMTALGRLAKRLQSGRLDAYLAYMLIALIAVLAVVTAIG